MPCDLSLISLSRFNPLGLNAFLMKLLGQDPSSSCNFMSKFKSFLLQITTPWLVNGIGTRRHYMQRY